MLPEELRERLKDDTITEAQLWQITPAYYMLDFRKDDFCKLVKVTGIEKWLEKSGRWERFVQAEQDLSAKERYLNAKSRLEKLEEEKSELEEIVQKYKVV